MTIREVMKVRKKVARNVLTIPCCILLVIETIGRLTSKIAFGPDFSSQVWSTV